MAMPGFAVRESDGDLRWYPFYNRDGKYTFYESRKHDQTDSGKKVGRGFNFEIYLPGYWTPGLSSGTRRRIGGGSSLVVVTDDSDLRHYRFEENTFMVGGTGKKVGRGFEHEWDYYVAEWTGNGTSDLLVRDDEGHLRLFPWNGERFEDLGGRERVGDGFHKDKFPDIFPGYWRGSYPCIVVREKDGDLHLYPFDGRTFKGQGSPRRIGRGFGDKFTHFLVAEWMQNGTPDLIVRRGNNLIRYPYGRFDIKSDHDDFDDPPYETVGKGFKDDWQYLVGHWREPGKPDLLVCDGNHNMRFFPFDGERFVDLGGDEQVGKGWKFTHFFDFYPV
jgi:hypothetical protein